MHGQNHIKFVVFGLTNWYHWYSLLYSYFRTQRGWTT